jgi:hypothetical protein
MAGFYCLVFGFLIVVAAGSALAEESQPATETQKAWQAAIKAATGNQRDQFVANLLYPFWR